MMAGVAAPVAAESTYIPTFPVAGRKYKLKNNPMALELGQRCPDANPSTATFCKAGKTMKIVGNFAAPDLGVCGIPGPYGLQPNAVVTYEQYGDMVIFRISNSLPEAFRCMVLNGKKVCEGLRSQRFGVSYLTDVGPADC